MGHMTLTCLNYTIVLITLVCNPFGKNLGWAQGVASTLKAVDISSYENGELTASKVKCFKSSGYSHLILAHNAWLAKKDFNKTGTPFSYEAGVIHQRNWALKHARFAADAGMTLGLYTVPYFDEDFYRIEQVARDTVETANHIEKSVRGVKVGQIWLDLEINKNFGRSHAEISNGLKRALNIVCAKTLCGIYTNLSTWKGLFNNSREYIRYPLWNAKWDQNPALDAYEPYGGWSMPSMKQYDDARVLGGLCGVGVDYNTMLTNLINTKPGGDGSNEEEAFNCPAKAPDKTFTCRLSSCQLYGDIRNLDSSAAGSLSNGQSAPVRQHACQKSTRRLWYKIEVNNQFNWVLSGLTI